MATVNLEEKIGRVGVQEYINNVFLPTLRQAHTDKQVTDQDLAHLFAEAQKHGVTGLSPEVHKHLGKTRNNEAGGEILFTQYTLPSGTKLSHVIKQSRNATAFDAESKNHSELLRAAGSEHIPDLLYKGNKFLVIPFVNEKTAHEKLKGLSPEQKATILQPLIEQYADFSKQIQSAKLPKTLKDFNEFITGKIFENNPLLAKQYASEIGDFLNASRTHNMLGDAHTQNILLSKDNTPTYIDFEDASSNGFAEFDLRKLLSKTGLNAQEEYELVIKTAHMFSGDETIERYVKNRITQDMLAISRYEKNLALEGLIPGARNRLRDMTGIAAKENIISAEFADELKNTYAADNCTSNTLPQTIFTSNIPVSEAPSAETSLYNLENLVQKEIKSTERKSKLKTAFTFFMAGAIAVGIAGFSSMKNKKVLAEAAIEKWQDLSAQQRNLNVFYDEFEAPYKFGLPQILHPIEATARNMMKQRLSVKDNVLDSLTIKYNLPEDLLKNMVYANELMAGYGNHAKIPSLAYGRNSLRILDPQEATRTYRTTGEIILGTENAIQGAARLDSLYHKHEGDLVLSLVEFYLPALDNNTDSMFDPTAELVFNKVVDLAHSALNGTSYAYDGGIRPRWVTHSPDSLRKQVHKARHLLPPKTNI